MSFDLSNPIFQVVVVALVPIITLIVGIFAYFRRHERKSISYKIINIIPLLDFREEVKDKIKITYMDKEVEDVTVSLIQFANTGSKEITPVDFIKPIAVIFDDDVKVLSAEIYESKPENLEVILTPKDNTLTIKLDLFNPKESFTIKMLTTKYFECPLKLDYRIAGVNIKEMTPKFTSFRFLVATVFFVFLTFFGGVFGAVYTKNDIFIWVAAIGIIVAVGILVFMGFSIALDVIDYFEERKTRRVLAEKENGNEEK